MGPSAWRVLAEGLPGRWVASPDGQRIDVDYRLTSRGSVLLETWMPDTPAETVTAYHLDGNTLMLTHYCGQGNQARLRLTGTRGRLAFSRFDATNLAADQSVLTDLTLAVNGSTLIRTETYVHAAAHERTKLVFERTASP